jgi:hypothetical protein
VKWYGKYVGKVFRIFNIISYLTYFSSTFSISFNYSTYLSSIFSLSFHYSTCLSSIFFHISERIWDIWRKDKLNGEMIWKIQKNIVKKQWKYRRKVSWIVIRSIFSISFHNFLLYFPYLITIQLGYLPYFPYHFTILFRVFHIFLLMENMEERQVEWWKDMTNAEEM